MIRFACPGCRWEHLANPAFAGYIARCVRCGVQLSIPEQSTAGAAVPVARPTSGGAARPGGGAAKPARRAAADDEFLDELPDDQLDDFDADEDEAPPARVKPSRPAAARPTRAPAGPVVDADPPPPAAGRVAKTLTAWWADKRKRVAMIAGPVAVLGLVAVLAFSGGKPKLPPVQPLPTRAPAALPPAEPPPAEPPPPVKVEPPRSYPVAPPPHDPQPEPVYRLTVARLLQDRRADPAGYDRRLAGRVVELMGVCRARAAASLTLTDGREDEETPITCAFPATAGGPPGSLRPGDPVTVRGTYKGDARLAGCWVAATTAPADELYLGRQVQLTGIVLSTAGTEDGVINPAIEFEPPATDARVSVRCVFRPSQRPRLAKLKPGDPVALQGVCGGRAVLTVKLDDCAVLTAAETDDLSADVVRVTADRLAQDYEADLLPADRPDPTVDPILLDPDQLAAAFQTDVRAAGVAYRHKWVQLRGRVLLRNQGTHTVTFETGTSQRFRVSAVFLPRRFADLPPEAVFTVRGVCSGAWGKTLIRLENAEYVDPDPQGGRTELDHLPFRPRGEFLYDALQPTRPKDNPVRRVSVRFLGTNLISTTTVKVGTFPGDSLFGPDRPRPKWTRDLSKVATAEAVIQYRVRGDFVEILQPAAQDLGAQSGPYWEPALKAGMKRGRSWSAEAPDGRLLKFTVQGFGQDAAKRSTVEILKVVEHPKLPGYREETRIGYARGVGEVWRVTRMKSAAGLLVVTSETQLVEIKLPETAELRPTAAPSAAP